ncbi:MAG: YgfZ/GcvT domain-containing protein [Isosphaeraceae bacterium]
MDEMNSGFPMGNGIGLVDRSDRVRIELKGPDRAKFLHNLTTNEVKRLPAGKGCEAFVTSTQGKTIGYVIIHAVDDRILVRTDPAGMELALPHFRKYGIFDDVTIDDCSEETFEIHLFGPGIEGPVARIGCRLPEAMEYAHSATELGGRAVRVVRESPTGFPGLTLIGDRRDAMVIHEVLKDAGGFTESTRVDPSTFESLRIEAGTPVFGKDITEKNLPQEIGRDARAISFVKGCYLGQETVARIDALGHVNQVLKGLVFEPRSSCPVPGSSLESDGKRIGVITSSVLSPTRGCPLALALIRTSHATAEASLEVETAPGAEPITAKVSDLPFPWRL